MSNFAKLSRRAAFIADVLKASEPIRDGSLDGVNARWAWRNQVNRFAVELHDYDRTDEDTFKKAAGYRRETVYGGYAGPAIQRSELRAGSSMS